MNDLYLIGNGFDLAHGLKTSYNDFLLWYLSDFLRKSFRKDHHDDDLLKIDRLGAHYNLPDNFNSVKDIFQKLKDLNYSLKAKHDFFESIIKNYRDYKWVDIEYEYYLALVKLYKDFEEDRFNDGDYLKGLKPLNDCLESIKNKLEEYLITINIDIQRKHMLIANILTESTGLERNDFGMDVGEKLFLYFNYTTTLDLYSEEFSVFQSEKIYIHGKLGNPDNPIIFGYGDEMDPHYEKIENLNNNEFLRNIKSFGYFRTDNYQKVMRFIEGVDREFTVKILGHSCGLSDRILLNTIFEHPNCKAIKIYYYQKSETKNDYFEKTQEISRHFKALGKSNMRTKIVPFPESVPLVPFDEKN